MPRVLAVIILSLISSIMLKVRVDELPIMHLNIDEIDFKGDIYSKDSNLNNIEKNIIIMDESDYPDKEGGIVIIGGHSGIGKYAYFKFLNKLNINDLVELTYNNETYNYHVINIYLDPKDGSIGINNYNNKNMLILYTCNPGDKENYLVIACERA